MEPSTRQTFGHRVKARSLTMADRAVVNHGPAMDHVVDREVAALAARARRPGTPPLFIPAETRLVSKAPTIRPTSGRKDKTPRLTMVDQAVAPRGPSSERAVRARPFPASQRDYKHREPQVTART